MPGGSESVAVGPAGPVRRARVLVADDDAALRGVVCALLTEAGFEAVAVPDGEETWRRLAAGETFDVLLLDEEMPGLRGVELVSRVREAGGTTPIVMMSGSLALDASERDRLGLFAVLRKPVPASELVATLRRALVWPSPTGAQ